MELVIELIVLFAVMFVGLLIIFGHDSKKRRPKSDWVSRENYEHFLHTGDRRFLYEKNYKKKGYNDYEDTDYDDFDDKFDAEDKESERVMREAQTFIDKDKPKLILPDSYIMEQQQRNARRKKTGH